MLIISAVSVGVMDAVAPERTAQAAGFVVDTTTDAGDANPGDGECATTADECTLRAAVQEANAHPGMDTITVEAGTYELTVAAGTIEPPEPPEQEVPSCHTLVAGAEDGDLDITCPVTITGEGVGVTIVDGGEPPSGAPIEQLALDRLFDIHQSAGDVTISGLTLREGYHAEAGGAIANASGGTLTLEDVVVRDSSSTAYGGGIYSGEPLEVECAEPCNGGAPTLELIDVSLLGNHTGGSGGGAFVQFGELTVTGGEISDNHADSGGGVFNGGELTETGVPAIATFDGVTFDGNVALGAGGAINGDHEGIVTIADSDFTGNTAFDYGGAVAVGGKSELSIAGGTFDGNVAVGEGGAVTVAAERAVDITGATFTHNEAGKTLPDPEVPGEIAEGEGGGGALFLGGSGPITMSGLTVNENTATHEGGGIMIENNASVDIDDSTINGNRSLTSGGGGIENAGLRVTLRNLTINHNEAYEDGGAIQGHGSGPFTVLDSTLAHNTAENGGGFSNAADGTTHFDRVLIWDNRSVVRVNDDAGLGGGIYGLGDAFAEYQNVTIAGNFAQVRGGGFYADADASISVVNTTISRNVAPVASGVGDEGTDFNFPIIPSLSVIFQNTIVAENLLSPSCNFALGSAGGNVEDGDSCTFRGSRDRAHANNVGLDAVADNGGPVMTMALQPDSQAIDGGVNPCPKTDARGVTRPQNVHCDSGAYEYDATIALDGTAPIVDTIVGPYQDTLETSAFEFTGHDGPDLTTGTFTPADELLFECLLVEGDPTEPPEFIDPTEPINPLDPEFLWVGCPSPWQVKLIEEGLFTLKVRAIDKAGNVGPERVHIFGGVDDLTPPQTLFTHGPAGPIDPPGLASVVASSTSFGTVAAFEFTANDGPTGTPPQFMEYECRVDTLDPEAWLECTSPATVSNLGVGEHFFQVRAGDAMDNVDPTPATYRWTIGPPPNCDAANITLFADRDTFVDEGLPNESFGTAFELEVRADANGDARTLVSFGVPNVFPDDCVLTSAQLRLYSEGDAGRTLHAAPIATAWTETGITWNNKPPTNTAVTPAATTSGSGYREWDVTTHVAGMLAGDIPSHGWVIREAGEGTEPGADHSITSRHLILEPPETQMPQLILRFAGPPTPTPPAPPLATIETAVECGDRITESIRLANSLFDCPFDGLIIGAPNIDVDLNGHVIDGLNYLLTGEEDGLPAAIRNVGHANVRIHNGTVQEMGNGVQLMAGAHFNVVEDLIIRANAVAGIELDDADNGNVGNEIRDNLLLGNGESGIWLVYGTEGTYVHHNTFDGNAGVAVHLLDARLNRIEDNVVSGVNPDPALDSDGGMMLESASDNVILRNEMAETGDAGVSVSLGSHRNLIQDNIFTRTGDAGVSVADSDGNRIIGNTAHLGSDAGVVLGNAVDSEVIDNDVRFNPSGVDISGVSDSLIADNEADYSDGAGIGVGSGSFRNRILNNRASNTSADGIAVEGEAVDEFGNPDFDLGNVIANNTTNSNLGSGIAIGGVGHTLTANSANSNAGFGIDAGAVGDNEDGTGNTASGNTEIDPVDGDQCSGIACGIGTPAPPPAPDTTAPDTSFVTRPTDGHGMLETVHFTFTGTDNVAPETALHYECRLDPGAESEIPEPPDLEPPDPGDPDVFEGENWIECANPVTFRLLTTGEHTFEVRAIDPFDNFDQSPATYTWNVTAMPYGDDVTPPTITIHEGPSDPSTETSATFRFGGSDDLTEGPALVYSCTRDGNVAPCTSPVDYTGLGLGTHTFSVTATDRAGLTSGPATWTWTIVEPPPDVTAPVVTIDSGPDPTTVSTDAELTFSSDDPTATLTCQLDGVAQPTCDSPAEFTGLARTAHTFVVTATDPAGNAGSATHAWAIGPAPVERVVTCGETITVSTRLADNLFECPGDGIIIGAPGITLDLNGFFVHGLNFEASAGVRNNGHDNVTITGPGKIVGFGYGVLLNPGATGNIITEATVELNTLAGIQLSNADDGFVGNTIRDNTVGGNGDGIALINGTQHTLVDGNTVSGSQLVGIRVLAASANAIEDNLIAGSAQAAVLLEGASANTIVDNVAFNSGGDAIAVTAFSNRNRIEGNRLSESSNGLFVIDSVQTEVLDNVIQLMGGNGIHLENAHDSLIRGNDVRFTSGGVELKGASNNRIEANVVNENDGGSGIAIGDMSLENVIVLNTVNFNSAGIVVSDPAGAGSGNLIDRNTVLSNVGDGISVTNVGHIIAGNLANQNGGWGIYAETATAFGSNLDGGGNTAVGNGIGLPDQQCFNIVCNVDDAPSSDPLAPETTILDGPEDPSVLGATATFEFIGFDNASAVTFECRLDSADPDAWEDCTSPHQVPPADLALGSHTFEVRAVDFVGNEDPSPAAHTWSVENPPTGIAPNTTITAAPDATSTSTQATFTFTSNEPGVTFVCQLDTDPVEDPCQSPRTYSGLAPGSHTFAVWAVDIEGNPDPSPATFTWTIAAEPVAGSVTCGLVVTQSIRVTNDLFDCPQNGLVVGAAGIVIDLDGHTIDGIGGGAGILNNGRDGVVVRNGNIEGFDVGVLLNPGTSTNIVADLTLMANEVAGIQLVDADGNTLRDNDLTGSIELAGNGDGISLIVGSNGNVVRANTIAVSALNGIHVQSSHLNTITANEISGSSAAGLWLEGSSNNSVVGNTFSANSGGGVVIELFADTLAPSNGNVVEGNTMTFNAGPGISVSESHGSQLLTNTIENNSDNGIIVELANDSVIRGNTLRANAGGIELSDSNDAVVEANNISAGAGAGVEVSGVSLRNVVVSNLIIGNNGEGISVSDATTPDVGTVVMANTVSNNGGDGIFVAGGHTVTDNAVNFNDGWGIYAETGSVDGGGNTATGNAEPLQCFGVVCTVGPNPGAPDTQLLTGPPMLPIDSGPPPTPPVISNSTRAWFTYTGSDDTTAVVDLSFECRLDSTDVLAWQECEQPAEYLDLSPGAHTFEVRAVDLQENVDPTPASYEWTVAPMAGTPDTFIESAPVSSSLLEVFFKFSSNDPDATFECSMDGELFTPCANEPEMVMANWYVVVYEFEEFQVGEHTFQVRARKGALVDATPASHTWVIGGLVTTVTDGPAYIPPEEPGEPAEGGETIETTATFTYEANLADVEFFCRLDFAITDFQPCGTESPSTITYTGLTAGEHIFEVFAVHEEFEQLETTVYEWVVLPSEDTTPPTALFITTPENNSPQTLFRFTGTDNQTSPFELTYECRLLIDGVQVLPVETGTWETCDNPLLTEPETHVFDVVQVLYGGDYAAFEAAVTAGGVPHTFTFELRAIDAPEPIDPEAPDPEPNVQDPPTVHSWTPVADVEAPVVDILTGPEAPVLIEDEMLFTFEGTDNGTDPLLLVFECALDGPPASAFVFEECDSFLQTAFSDPYEVSGLEAGDYTLRVRATDLAGNVSAEDTYSWTVIGPPTTTILTASVPAAPATTTATTATFTFAADQPNSTFTCSLNGSEFEPCATPLDVIGLGDGNYSLEILATNEHGLVEEVPVGFEWVVAGAGPDLSAPDTTILTGPPTDAPTPITTAQFTFTSTELGSQFECRLLEDVDPLDPTGGFSGCEPGIEYTELAGGPHTFEVRAIDLNGNIDPTPASWTWTVAAAPTTTILSGPEEETAATTATFTYESSVAGAEFFCARAYFGVPIDDNGDPIATGTNPFTPCDGGVKTYTDLPAGEYQFVVYSQANGFQDVEGDDWDWIVVDTAELTTSLTPSATATGFTFEFEANIEPATFECRIDGVDPWFACASPYELDTTGFGFGAHTFEVRATALGQTEATPAVFTWSIAAPDTTPPNTAITSGPPLTTVSSTAAFTFSSSEFGATFECALAVPGEPALDLNDPSTWDECVSPHLLDGLEAVVDGLGIAQPYTLHVRAVDAAGNPDATPAEHVWTILPDVTAPDTTITSGPTDGQVIGATVVQFTFTGTDDGTPVLDLEFECQLSLTSGTIVEPWSGCESSQQPFQPHLLEGLLPGEYRFEVRATDLALNVDLSPATRTFTIVDITPPDQPSIDSGPDSVTEDTTAVFTFSTGDPTDTFECSIDGADFAACTSGVTEFTVAVAPHTFQVRAVDTSENVGPASDLYEWEVVSPDPPDTTIVSGPPSTTELTDALFTFSSTPAVLEYECRLDATAPEDPWVGCETPHEITGLTVGAHTLEVRAVDAAGKFDATPAPYSWTVLPVSLPVTTINTAPPATTEETTALFTFSSNEAGSEFECSLDSPDFTGCEPPAQYTDLAAGAHTFRVRAIDVDDNVGPEVSHTWTVVEPPPPPVQCTAATTTYSADADSWIDQGSPTDNKGTDSVLKVMSKSGANVRALVRFNLAATLPPGCVVETATLRLFAAGSAPGRTLQALQVTSSWTEGGVSWGNQPATTGAAATTTSGDGYRQWDVTSQLQAIFDAGANHGFLIRDAVEGQDAEQQLNSREKGENLPQLVVSYMTPDTTAPETTLSGQPPDPALDGNASFVLGGSDDSGGTLTFQCQLDGMGFAPCASPAVYTNLPPGTHTFEVFAVDPSGNEDPTSQSYTWTVPVPTDTDPPETTIDTNPGATTQSTSATFTFSADELGSTFQCALDAASFAPCTSPVVLTGLVVGAHTFRVQATDPVGNVDSEPASFSWTIAPSCAAGSVTVGSAADSWIEQSDPSKNLGTDSSLKVTSKNGNSNTRALVRFNLPAVPAGCQVTGAQLRLFAGSATNGRTLQARRITAGWTEGAVTWGNQPGSDAAAATTASGTGWRQWNVLSQVQQMYTTANNGFLIRDANEGNSGGPVQEFHSREKAPDNPPQLVITFGPA